jgi:hypothetical protein
VSATTPGAPAWTQIATDGATRRWGHTAQYDAARDRMLVFAGENASGQLSDLLVFQLATGEWQRTDMGPWVSPRSDLASAIDTVNDRLVIIGGRQGLITSIADVMAMDLATGAWIDLPQGPAPRHDIVAASDGAHAWVFGGVGALLHTLDDLWQLDFATDTWTELPQPEPRPPGRGSYALVYLAGGVYLVGGHDVTSVQRDAWRYDLAAQTWTQLTPSSSPAAWAHFGFALDDACARLVLTAGDNLDNEDTALTTGLALDGRDQCPTGSTAEWRCGSIDEPAFARVPTSNLPPPRDHTSLIADPTRRQLVLFGGGQLGDGLGTFGDAWTLPLEACP